MGETVKKWVVQKQLISSIGSKQIDWGSYDIEGYKGLFKDKETHPEIPANISGVYLGDKKTIPVPAAMDEITSNKERAAVATPNVNIECNNS